MNIAEKYAYKIRWSSEDGEYVATVAEFPSLSWLAPNMSDALAGLVQLVTNVCADMEDSGEEIPVPMAEREYSGKLLLRIPPEKHRSLAIEAASQGVSLNRLISSRV